MHTAPPVRISLAPDAAWHACVVVSCSVAAANMAAWFAVWGQASTGVVAVSALLAAGCAVGLAALLSRQRVATVGVLTWDGAGWQWSPHAAEPLAGELQVRIDLGAWLLLRFKPTAPNSQVSWLALSRRNAVALWPVWRAALYSRRPGRDLATASDPE